MSSKIIAPFLKAQKSSEVSFLSSVTVPITGHMPAEYVSLYIILLEYVDEKDIRFTYIIVDSQYN